MNITEMPTRYDASSTESKWYERWEAAGLFKPDPDPAKQPYCITIPPPNITGSLHMGHVLCYSLQDLLGRYQRMRGQSVLILPGQDHAGIATQSVVEKQLRKQGTSAAQIGREQFVERVWQWRDEAGNTILEQLRQLGCAFDWSRGRFTLDERYAQAVLKVFVEWFERGLIFRGKRVVNWDPALQTSVSDIETERRTFRGKLYYIRYPFANGEGHVTIATTRPETMLADVAVAVHPSDGRYKDKVGQTLILPLLGREIPLIADIYPDPEFGSGAVKITPAHDPNDHAVGTRHGLPMPVLLDERARITEEGGVYAGLDRNEARKRIVQDLDEQGFLEKIEDHDIPIIISERSGEVIEPLLSEQWFCDQAALAKPVIDALERGEIRFHPERYNHIFLDWMQNLREWCLSRQLWWGHRIPIYYDAEDTAYAALSWEEAQRKAGDKPIVRQDDDVLDTWFSSGLWPFATLGWPEQTEDLKRFYPTDVLVTDRNIINLWVARMTMMGFDLTGEKPFSDVMIFATVLREDGRRMSKSLGTGIDPMQLIGSIGADALRYTLLSQTGENQDLRFSDRRTEEARNFCNKIWNATRFVLMTAHEPPELAPDRFELVDEWLLSRLYDTVEKVRDAYDTFDIQTASHALYRFFWSELCDWYIEVSKPRLANESENAAPRFVLFTAIEAFLKMIHPIMPHLSEELYSYLPGKSSEFLMSSPWPDLPSDFKHPDAEGEIERTFEITRSLRALRAEVGLPAMRAVEAVYYEGDLGAGASVIASQAWFGELRPGKPSDEKFITTSAGGVDWYLPTAGLIDLEKETQRLDKEEHKAQDELAKIEQRLANPMFRERAKPEIVEREEQTAAELREALDKIRQRRNLLGSP